MKYLVVYNTYAGTHYTGQFTRLYETYNDMLKEVNEVSNDMKVEAIYEIADKIEL